MKKRITLIVSLILVVSLLCGCGALAAQTVDKTITCNELSMVLTAAFTDFSEESAADGLAFNYASDKIGVCGIYEDKAYLQEFLPDIDVQTYTELFLESNNVAEPIEVVDGITRFSYSVDGDPSYTYLCGVFESGTNFWVVQAYCESDDYASCQEDMWKYICSVSVA